MIRKLSVLLVPLFASCSLLVREPVAPLPVDTEPAVSGRARELVVLMPGRGERQGDFRRQGVIDEVGRQRPDAHVIAPDAHLGYYFSRTIVGRLREDVIGPARRRGERVTLLGVSLGGLGSLAYALEHPGEVDQILLVAPYLGEEELFEEIRKAGGLRRWEPRQPLDEDDYGRRLWKRIRDQWVVGGRPPPMRLVVGRDDHLLAASRLLGDEVMGREGYREVDGRHTWAAWRPEFAWLLAE